jgi:hypothetical protein
MLGISTRAPLPTAVQSISPGVHLLTTSGPSASRLSSVNHFETQALLPSLPGTKEIEIWSVAVMMINRYADEAKLNSLRRAAELTVGGDHVRAAIWRRVTMAIEQLIDTTGPLN